MGSMSQFENIRRFSQATSAIKGPAPGSRPKNDRVNALSPTPRQRFIQQPLSKSVTPHFRDNIEVRYVSMKLGLVLNWIREFLKQLHANMPKQLFTVVDNPAAPSARAGTKSFVHPRCTSSNKPRFGFRCRTGFCAKLITQLSQRRRIAWPCHTDSDGGHPQIVPDSPLAASRLHSTTKF